MEKDLLKQGKSFLNDFKEFISRGNVLDMAVGVIIGTAFGKIVTSIVNDILMPIIGVIIGGHDFSSLSIEIGDAMINYGMFIQNIIDFLIVAFCIFVIVKVVNTITHKEEKKKEEVPKKDEQVVLLEEIRDLLKKEKKTAKTKSKTDK